MIDATRSQPRPGQIVALWSPSHGPDVGQYIRNCMPYWLTSHGERLSDVALWWPVDWPAPVVLDGITEDAAERKQTGDSLVNVAGELAAKFLERQLKTGGGVEIPSLGLTIEGDEAVGDE